MNEAIKISNLSKSYGTHVVLNGLDFCVQQGEIFALLGVNGAGKTTSLECIEGLRKYDSGSEIYAYSVNDCIWCNNGIIGWSAPISC